eukprot:TRINITY_DN189_c0_g1_i1.p1 TRINITY_DN189_c0_g1~~TRINITY_DN189_c0_g1_i1.p1  ORF type:complete len:257 (+),score=38.40 TRINITY_DN189_c0_g1_i1:58-771(+)
MPAGYVCWFLVVLLNVAASNQSCCEPEDYQVTWRNAAFVTQQPMSRSNSGTSAFKRLNSQDWIWSDSSLNQDGKVQSRHLVFFVQNVTYVFDTFPLQDPNSCWDCHIENHTVSWSTFHCHDLSNASSSVVNFTDRGEKIYTTEKFVNQSFPPNFIQQILTITAYVKLSSSVCYVLNEYSETYRSFGKSDSYLSISTEWHTSLTVPAPKEVYSIPVECRTGCPLPPLPPTDILRSFEA